MHTVLGGIPWVTSSIYSVAIETISKETEERSMGISGAAVCLKEMNSKRIVVLLFNIGTYQLHFKINELRNKYYQFHAGNYLYK